MSAAPQPPIGGDQYIGYKLEAVALSTFVAAAIAVSLRLFSRLKYARVGWDDAFMLLAIVLALIATVMEFIALDRGLGRHLFYLTPWQRQQMSKYNSLGQAFCIMSLSFCKTSICISLLRIIQGSNRFFMKWLLYAILVLVNVVNIVIVITLFEQCQPTSKIWNSAIPGKCWAFPIELDLAVLQGAISAFTDFLLSGLPILVIQHLHIEKRNRIILGILLGLGFFTGIIAIIRTVQTSMSIYATGPSDSSWGSILPLIWASSERNIAIMAASIPAIRPLFQSFLRLTSHWISEYRYYCGTHGYQQNNGSIKMSETNTISGSNRVWGYKQEMKERQESVEGILPQSQEV